MKKKKKKSRKERKKKRLGTQIKKNEKKALLYVLSKNKTNGHGCTDLTHLQFIRFFSAIASTGVCALVKYLLHNGKCKYVVSAGVDCQQEENGRTQVSF